jgi:hypothetical protein
MARLSRTDAHDLLARAGVPVPSPDFHTLHSAQVEKLLILAKAWRYREPKNANGSRARYFHAYLCRAAERDA